MDRLRRFTILAVLFFAAGLLTGCSGTPSTALARQEFERTGQLYFFREGQSKIVAFRKANGMMSGDGTSYIFEYEATLECLKDWTFQFGLTEPRSCKAGETVTKKGRITFVRTERGWKKFS